MKIDLVASTGKLSTKEDMIRFGRDAARICYSELDFDQLQSETDNGGLADTLLNKGHHSPYEHAHMTFYIREIPKMGAMILNNENVYVTSEKSARYTTMQPTQEQKELYDKWMDIFLEKIENLYPSMNKRTKQNLAKENARYLTSVFTPTKMLHTVSFRQLNYIMHFFDSFIRDQDDTHFNTHIKNFMSEFNQHLRPFYDERLEPADKRRSLSLFAKRDNFKEEFGENYSTTFNISFAGLAQQQRHRTLGYQMQIPKKATGKDDIFMPAILDEDHLLSQMWYEDMLKIAEHDFPQGQLVKVNEYGHYSDFLSKATERLCGHAQWEIMNATKNTLERYIKSTFLENHDVHKELLDYSYGPRCTFPHIKCKDPCIFGKKSLERLI